MLSLPPHTYNTCQVPESSPRSPTACSSSQTGINKNDRGCDVSGGSQPPTHTQVKKGQGKKSSKSQRSTPIPTPTVTRTDSNSLIHVNPGASLVLAPPPASGILGNDPKHRSSRGGAPGPDPLSPSAMRMVHRRRGDPSAGGGDLEWCVPLGSSSPPPHGDWDP